MESEETIMSRIGAPTARPTALKSRLKGSTLSKQAASSPGPNSSIAGSRMPSSSGGLVSRSVMPSGGPTLRKTSKSSRSSTPTSRATLPSSRLTVSGTKSIAAVSKPTASAATPTAFATKPAVPSRSSTPLSSSTARSSTPTSRPSIPPSKSASRAATPTRRSSTQSSAAATSAPPIKLSPSITKAAPVTSRNPVPSHGSSPTVKPRLWKPSDMPGFSLEAPTNLRTSLPERLLSATRGRPGAPSSRSSSVEPGTNVRPRRQSCSPSGERVPNGVVRASGSSVPAVHRHSKVNDNVSPVVIGTQMVERMMNMRKLVPPKQDNRLSSHGNLSGKLSSSPDSLGFGRMLSKKSLDMAIRHMDIRRTIPCDSRPLTTKIPASSMYSVRSGHTQQNS